MSTSNQEFSRVFLLSIAADYFLISKQLGLIKDKNFRCNQSLANIYKPLFAGAGITYGEWVEPFSGAAMFCSSSSNEQEMDNFFDEVENLCVRINVGLRPQFNIPMPQIYKDGKELDVDLADAYLTNIERFCKNIPDDDNALEIPIVNANGNRLNVSIGLHGPL
jgi:hypothetical protein